MSSKRFKHTLDGLRRIPEMLEVRRNAKAVMIHDSRWVARLPVWASIPLLCGRVKGRLTKPPELTIALCHNRPYRTALETSLDYVGGIACEVGQVPTEPPWKHTHKILGLLDVMRRKPRTEYILYSDSDDAVLRNDPQFAIDLLDEYDCDMLFSSSYSNRTYKYMPEVERWLDTVSPAESPGGRYLCAGVFMGRWDFVQTVLEEATQYICDGDVDDAPRVLERHRGMVQNTDRFPFGVDNDQTLFRYLHPQFHPRIRVDTQSRLALRSQHRIGPRVRPARHREGVAE